MGLAFAICDLAGRTIAPILNRQPGSEVVVGRNQIRAVKVMPSIHDETARHAYPYARRLKAWLDGQIVFCGPIVSPRFQPSQGVVEISALDPGHQLEHAYVRLPDVWAPDPSGAVYGVRYTQADQGQIMAALAAHVRSGEQAPWGGLGVPEHGIIPGAIEQTVLRDRAYEPGKQVWGAWVEMGEVIAGPDFELEPVHATDGVAARLNVYERQGTDRSATAVFEYNLGRHNCADATWEPDASGLVNCATVIGQTEEGQEPPHHTSEQPESRQGFGTWESFDGRPDVSEAATTIEAARGHAAEHSWPVNRITIDVAAQDGTWLGTRHGNSHYMEGLGTPPRLGPNPGDGVDQPDCWVGDTVGVFAREGAMDVAGGYRIEQATLTEVDTAGTVQAKVELAPPVFAAAVT